MSLECLPLQLPSPSSPCTPAEEPDIHNNISSKPQHVGERERVSDIGSEVSVETVGSVESVRDLDQFGKDAERGFGHCQL